MARLNISGLDAAAAIRLESRISVRPISCSLLRTVSSPPDVSNSFNPVKKSRIDCPALDSHPVTNSSLLTPATSANRSRSIAAWTSALASVAVRFSSFPSFFHPLVIDSTSTKKSYALAFPASCPYWSAARISISYSFLRSAIPSISAARASASCSR